MWSLAQAHAQVALIAHAGGFLQHQRLHLRPCGGRYLGIAQQQQQCVGLVGHFGTGLAPRQQGPFGHTGLGVGAQVLPQALLQRAVLHPRRQHDQAAQRVGLAEHGVGGAVVRVPGVVGHKGQRQAKQHPGDVDEGRHHAAQRVQAGTWPPTGPQLDWLDE